MGYWTAMERAGATVHNFEQFGSYQGDWWAYVTYEGVTGWVKGSYGSCSGCDAFQSEFDYVQDTCDDHRYNFQVDCKDCQAAVAEYDRRLADFGRGYLDGIMSVQDALGNASANLEWDMEAQSMVDFIRNVSGVQVEEDNEDKEIDDSLKRLGVLH